MQDPWPPPGTSVNQNSQGYPDDTVNDKGETWKFGRWWPVGETPYYGWNHEDEGRTALGPHYNPDGSYVSDLDRNLAEGKWKYEGGNNAPAHTEVHAAAGPSGDSRSDHANDGSGRGQGKAAGKAKSSDDENSAGNNSRLTAGSSLGSSGDVSDISSEEENDTESDSETSDGRNIDVISETDGIDAEVQATTELENEVDNQEDNEQLASNGRNLQQVGDGSIQQTNFKPSVLGGDNRIGPPRIGPPSSNSKKDKLINDALPDELKDENLRLGGGLDDLDDQNPLTTKKGKKRGRDFEGPWSMLTGNDPNGPGGDG